jgi:hypothetical protein
MRAVQLNVHLRRSRTSALPATLTPEEWATTLADFRGLCAYCETRPARGVEHFVPAQHGGGTTAGNCLPSCAPCNTAKLARMPHELDPVRFPAERVAVLVEYLRKRSTGPDVGTPGPETSRDLIVKGMQHSEVAELDAIVARRNAHGLMTGSVTSRNSLVVSYLRDAIAKERVRLARMRP